MKANSDKSKQSNKATRRVLAGVLCGASVLSLVLSLVMPPISQAIANDGQPASTEEAVADENTLDEEAGAGNSTGKDAENRISDDGEGGEGEDAAAADPAADDAGAESAVQPADDGADDENSIALADVNANGDIKLQGDVTDGFTNGGSYCLTSDAWSTKPIEINKDTKIDLAGHKLYYYVGNNDTFITVKSGALTIEDSAKPSDNKTSTVNDKNPGQPAEMKWTSDNNGTTPQSLTYYETTSTPSEDKPGTTETTTKHVVSGFGAIVAASNSGSVQQVIYVADGGTLNLNGGMITTPRDLASNGHIIFAEGKSNETQVNINGGFITGANLNQQCGGWGGGLCVTGANAKLNMTNGVIAANKAASGGGIYADQGATLNLSGGVISGNATYGYTINNGDDTNAGGYGGGVYTKGANVTISGSACITNNRVNDRVTDNLYNNGVLGGGGIACTHGGTLTMTDGSVTANYSHEAGGGIYAGFWNQWIKFKMTGGIIAGNMSENAEGGGLRISTGTTGDIGTEPGTSNKIYITNNKTMTGSTNGRGGDWGGGGIFIQQGGKLNIVQTLITNNEAGGWGGGVGACPTGETIVSHSNGAAIYNNADHGEHFSAGGHDKDLDSNTNYITKDFKDAGHEDFFLVRKDDSNKTVAVVLGKMLGGGSAGWKGTCDRQKITIDPNGGAEAKYMFGLEAHPNEEAVKKAKLAATTIISGNYSYTHGGGIMTNGDLTVGEVSDLSVYPNMRLYATKVLKDEKGISTSLSGHNYKFKLLRKDGTTEPSWKEDGTLDIGECSVAGKASVDQTNGNITFDSGKDYSSGQYVFYLVEEPISGENELNTKFDETIYKIVVKVGDKPYKTDQLMQIPINYYTVEGVTVSKKAEKDNVFEPLHSDSGDYSVRYSEDNTTATVTIGNDDKPTFTNKIEPYNSLGSWTPAATKVVKGGEMKEFTLEFADNEEFDSARRVKTKAGGVEPQKLYFPNIEYNLDDLKQGDSGDPGRGACKDFKYYVRESTELSLFSNYTYDKSVYRFDVRMKDNEEGKIEPEIVTFTKIKDAHGDPIADSKPINFDSTKPESTPTFTNTYSTSLPLSGMSGVTLTYLAGAAVLCAAAAWMHIRRKANAKGGERRE
ncbi:Spy0128 family protein [Collinsella aerofaciens]|uniref:Spy0128 family protein n=1 Tax=Collinsella aerofaciens TaxID=74426 RepID=UPI0035686B3F